MIAAVRAWLTSVVAASLLLAAVETLLPDGTLQRIASFIGGLILLAVLLQPLENLELTGIAWDFSRYQEDVASRKRELDEAGEALLAEGIASRTEAYILDKAAALDLAVSVQVETAPSAQGVPLPESVTISGERSPELASYIEQELGIPQERQVWHEDEN